jgi:trans-aconitate 2-methyltransferase
MTAIWDPQQYLKFSGPRLRPALDLLAQIAADDVRTVYDLGCGPGNLTNFFKDRWPEADIIGVDASEEMLTRAREAHDDAHDPRVKWQQADLTKWRPDVPADVLYSNAALQWVDGHETLFPGLVSSLDEGGVFAAQMPRNHKAPSHALMHDVIEASPWADTIRGARGLPPVMEPEEYYDLLRPHVSQLNIWESEFLQVLEGDNAVAEWTKGSALKPYLDALETEDQRQVFFDDYADRLRDIYPKRPDGKTLFPFRRIFIVATR